MVGVMKWMKEVAVMKRMKMGEARALGLVMEHH